MSRFFGLVAGMLAKPVACEFRLAVQRLNRWLVGLSTAMLNPALQIARSARWLLCRFLASPFAASFAGRCATPCIGCSADTLAGPAPPPVVAPSLVCLLLNSLVGWSPCGLDASWPC